MKLIINKHKKLITSLVFVLAIFLISFHFTDTPDVWVDEGVFTNVAETLAHHGTLALQAGPGDYYHLGYFLSTNYPVIYPVAASLYLFGNGIWQARLPMLIYMFLLVISFYLFVKKRYGDLYGFYPAILSVLMLISFSPFYGNGRPVQGEVPGLLFLVLGALFLMYLEDSDFLDSKMALLAGLSFGLSAATKTFYLVLLSLSLIVTLAFWFRRVKNKKVLLVAGLGFILPVIFWFSANLETTTPLSQIFSSYINLVTNRESSISAPHSTFANLSRFFTESTPILFSLLFIIIVVCFVFRYIKKPILSLSVSECVISLFMLFNLLAYLPGPGWYRYFFPSHALAYLLFPAALFILADCVDKNLYKKILFAVPIALIVFQFYHLAFLSDTAYIYARTRNNILTYGLSKIDPSKKVLFYDTMEAAVFFRGNDYFQYSIMPVFFTLGDKNIVASSTARFDYVLVKEAHINSDYLRCYNLEMLGKYSLYKRMNNCLK